MKEVMIKSITENGEKALRQHLKEYKKMNWREKLIAKITGYRQEIVTETPYTLKLIVSNRWADKPAFMGLITGEIEGALKKNGATKNIDYGIDIK